MHIHSDDHTTIDANATATNHPLAPPQTQHHPPTPPSSLSSSSIRNKEQRQHRQPAANLLVKISRWDPVVALARRESLSAEFDMMCVVCVCVPVRMCVCVRGTCYVHRHEMALYKAQYDRLDDRNHPLFPLMHESYMHKYLRFCMRASSISIANTHPTWTTAMGMLFRVLPTSSIIQFSTRCLFNDDIVILLFTQL